MSDFLNNLFASRNFLSCDTPFEEADAVLFGVGFDGTTSYRPGTRFGPSQVRVDSYGFEIYSPYQDKNITDFKVHDAGDLDLGFGDTVEVLRRVEYTCSEILKAKKKPLMFGGEHLLTLGMVRALAPVYPDMHIIHFDAHTDLRDEFLGVELSHATVIKKCWDILGDGRIHSFGIRSGDKHEFEFAKEHLDFHPFEVSDVPEVAKTLKDVPVYITLDVDVLDPSVMPGTGTPEPGGVSFKELLNALLSLEGLNIIGFDINEFSPPCDISGISKAAAVKLLREMIMLL